MEGIWILFPLGDFKILILKEILRIHNPQDYVQDKIHPQVII